MKFHDAPGQKAAATDRFKRLGVANVAAGVLDDEGNEEGVVRPAQNKDVIAVIKAQDEPMHRHAFIVRSQCWRFVWRLLITDR
jgi:hypothetical protein